MIEQRKSGIRRARGVARKILVALAALSLLAAAGVWLTLRHPIPKRSGQARLAGLAQAAEVRFDARGVAHVRAATEADAFRVLGRLHAAERFFQMELRRRAAAGRLAEVLGGALVAFDQESRVAGHLVLARRDLAALSPERVALLAAYSEGVNDYLAHGPRALELLLLGVTPEPWTPLDSLAFSRFLLASLSEAPGREKSALAERHAFGALTTEADSGSKGSNAWAIAGSRTRGGKPILANDPHLAVEVPGVWYAAHLTSEDGFDVAGLTLAGIPGVVIGHNGRVAWGITMAELDDADVFFEPVNVESMQVAVEGGWLPLATRVERIRVRGGADVLVTVRATPRGTILGVSSGSGALRTAAVLAFAPDLAPSSVGAFLSAAKARSGAEIEAAWAGFGGPAINVCWAAADGRFGLRLAGAVPRRVVGGALPGGALSAWDGLVADAELPRLSDPAEGFVASANDDGKASGRPVPFAGYFASDDRILRLRERLAELGGATAEDSNALQNDDVSRYALRLVERIAAPEPRDERARRAVEILRAWDGRIATTGPSRLYEAVAGALAQRLNVRLWKSLDEALDAPDARWDDPATAAVEHRDEVLETALAESLDAVRAADGPDPAQWRWGKVHRLTFEHPFSSSVPLALIRNLLNIGPVEMPGDVHTPNVQAFRLGAESRIRHIPSARLVVDLADPDATTLVLPLGQSGHRADRHYHDQLDAWASGATFRLPFTRGAVDRATVSVLRLTP